MPPSLEYNERPPSSPLNRWVRCIWGLRAPAGLIGEPQPILPDGCMEIVYNLADRFSRRMPDGTVVQQHEVIVVGPMAVPVTVDPSGVVDLVGIRFQPWSGGIVTRHPLRDIRNLTPEASVVGSLLPPSLSDELADSTSFDGRVAIIERNLCAALKSLPLPGAALVAALSRLEQCKEPESIGSLARVMGTTQRTLQRNFETMVGLSPKLYSRITRMQRALAFRMSDETRTWSRVAQMAGYYDHAHMIHDFSDLAGFAPSTFDEDAHVLTETFVS